MGGLFSSNNENNVQATNDEYYRRTLYQRQLEEQRIVQQEERRRQQAVDLANRRNQILRAKLQATAIAAQVSRKQAELMRIIFDTTNTFEWLSSTFDGVKYEALDESSYEYIQLRNLFKSTTKRYFKIINIECVQNPFLFSSYLFKKEELKRKFGSLVTEELLFHGTRKANLDNICENNFDWRLHGRSLGNRFGQGVSFTPISYYASNYCDKNERIKVMIVAKVLTSKSCLGSKDMIIPPDGYDTSHKSDGHVIVKYNDDEFYPAYKLNFSIGNAVHAY